MNATITTDPLLVAAGVCVRCETALVPEGLFCPGCGLPAGFVPVAAVPAPPRTWRRRVLAVVAGIAGGVGAAAALVLVVLWIANSAMSMGVDEDAGDLRAVTFSTDGRLVMAASRQGGLTIWDVASGYPVRAIDTPDRGVAAFAPAGWTLATGARAGCAVTLWSAEHGARLSRLAPATARTGAGTATLVVAYAPDGGRLAAGCQDGSITVWNPETAAPLFTVTAHAGEVRALAFAPDGSVLYSGGADRVVRGWSLPGGLPRSRLTGLRDPVCSLAVTPDGGRLVGATDGVHGDERIIVWDAATGGETMRLGWDRGMAPFALSPDGNLLATTTLGSVAIVDGATGEVVRRLDLPNDGAVAGALAFSPDGRRLVVTGEGGMATVWDPASGALLRRLRW